MMSPPLPLFEADVSRRDGVAVLALRGELDLATRTKFEEAIRAIPPEVGIVLDVRDLEFVDGGALGRWAQLAMERQRDGAGFRVRNASPFLLRMLRVCELEWLLDGSESASMDGGRA